MSDIKQVKYDVPAPIVKRTRKGRPRTAATAVNKSPKLVNSAAKPSLAISAPAATNKTVTAAAVPTVVNSETSSKFNNAKTLQKAVNSVPNTTNGHKKKPTLNVNLSYLNSPHTPSPVKKTQQSPVKVNEKPVLSTTRKVVPRINIQPTKRKNFTMKRKFVARRIVIDIENANKSKKKRESIESKVTNMPLCDITKTLRENGMVRSGINPPEKMQRAMMIDLLMFPVPQ
jgi:hypothetical protein